jgi:hypothetical protein
VLEREDATRVADGGMFKRGGRTGTLECGGRIRWKGEKKEQGIYPKGVCGCQWYMKQSRWFRRAGSLHEIELGAFGGKRTLWQQRGHLDRQRRLHRKGHSSCAHGRCSIGARLIWDNLFRTCSIFPVLYGALCADGSFACSFAVLSTLANQSPLFPELLHPSLRSCGHSLSPRVLCLEPLP